MIIRSTNTDNLLYRLSKGPGQPMLRDRKRSSKIVELVDCLTDDADNLLRLVREAPTCGSYIKNVQHKEQITPANIFHILA